MHVNAPPEIAIHLNNPETLAAIDRAMGPGTSTVIAKPTVNIGTIKGGTKVNMIPTHASLSWTSGFPSD
jgi:metal-dependent amidase/aminoacylase/carboxypeptidase family protein